MRRSQQPDGTELVNQLETLIRRFISVTPEQSCVVAYWVLHTHAITAAEYTPYLNIRSALPQCGKTRLLEVLDMVVWKPWLTGRTTCSALVRTISADHPVLLIDESDAAFNGERNYSEALRGILNTGYHRDGKYSMSVLARGGWRKADFSTFCPKAIAGIGNLPPTVSDRAIPIELERRAKNQVVERLRTRKVKPEAERIRRRAYGWTMRNLNALMQTEPDLPQQLRDRQLDVCEPLLAIAQLIGNGEAARLCHSLLEVYSCSFASLDDEPLMRLLKDMKQIFNSRNVDRISTHDLLIALNDDETAPWSEFGVRGCPLTDAQLARLLRPVKIKPQSIRIGTSTPKGYMRDDFNDVWDRYVP